MTADAPRVLLVATTTGYQTRSFGDAAAAVGVRLVLATDRCDRIEDPWWDQAIPVRFHDEPRSLEAIRAAFDGAPPRGVLAVGDRPTRLAALAAAELGVPGHAPEAAAAGRNKLTSRRALSGAGLPVPWFRAVPADTDAKQLAGEVAYPCVLKPLALSGSRGVIRTDAAASFVDAFARVGRLLQAPDVRAERDPAHDTILVEGYLPGREYAVEGLLDRGVLHALALFDKPDPLDGPFFEETIYATPSALPALDQARVLEAVAAAAKALGLWHGPVHAECRVNDTGVFVLEVAARPIGGLCARALRFVPGDEGRREERRSLEEVLLRHAIGEDVSGFEREPDASGVMMIPIPKPGVFRAVAGVSRALSVPHVQDLQITAKPDQRLIPLPEGASYLGFIFARATDQPTVVEALRAAHAELQFRVDRGVPVR